MGDSERSDLTLIDHLARLSATLESAEKVMEKIERSIEQQAEDIRSAGGNIIRIETEIHHIKEQITNINKEIDSHTKKLHEADVRDAERRIIQQEAPPAPKNDDDVTIKQAVVQFCRVWGPLGAVALMGLYELFKSLFERQ